MNVMFLLLFISIWCDDVCELLPLTGLLFTPQVIHDHGKQWWNDIDRGKSKNSEKNLSQCHKRYVTKGYTHNTRRNRGFVAKILTHAPCKLLYCYHSTCDFSSALIALRL
jgi:hypothetical protein